MYLYFIFVADDARLSEALHRSHLSGASLPRALAPPISQAVASLVHRQPVPYYGKRAIAVGTSGWVPLPRC